MAWKLSSIVGSGIIIGGIAIGTLAFTGSESLNNISDNVVELKGKITNLEESLNNWKDSFNKLQDSATLTIEQANAKLTEKNGLISSLKSQIAELQEQLTTNTGNDDILKQEIERLNSELTKANTEVASLEAEIEAISAEVADVGNTVETAPTVELPALVEGEGDSGELEGGTSEPTEPTEPTTPPTDSNPIVTSTGFSSSATATIIEYANKVNELTPTGTYNITDVSSLDTVFTTITIEGTFTKPTETDIVSHYDKIRQFGGNKTLKVIDTEGQLLATRNTGWIMQ